MEERAYGKRENWDGSCYELAIDYSHLQAHKDLVALRQYMWQAPALRGPFAGPYSPAPLAAHPVPDFTAGPEVDPWVQYGMIEMPDHRFIGCQIHVASASWFWLCIPMGMLELVYSISYPITLEPNLHWMQAVNPVLIDIAQHVYAAVPFDFAVIDEEASAFYSTAMDITPSELEHGGCLISPALFHRVQPRTEWETLPSGLLWRDWQG